MDNNDNSNHYLKLLIETVDSAIISYDLDNKILSWNRFAEKLYQWKAYEVIGKDFTQVIIPKELEEEYDSEINKLRQGETSEIDSRILRKDGSLIPVHIITTHLTDIHDNKTGYIRICYNISDKIDAYEELIKSEKKYKDLANLLPQIVYEIDLNGKLTFVNQHAYEIFGVPIGAEINTFSVLEFLIPEDRERAAGNIKRILLGEEIANKEYSAIRNNGENFPVLIYARAMEKDSIPVGVRGLIVDISERKEMEKAIMKSKDLLSNILNNSTILFYAHTPQHQLVYLSPQSVYFLGCEPEDAMNRWTEFLTEHPLNEIGIKNTEKAIESGKKQPSYELELVRKDGQKIWVEVNEVPIVKNGITESIVGSLTDITEKKEAEKKLKIYQGHLEDLVSERTAGLNAKNKELDEMLKVFVGREMKIKKLEKENSLLRKKYDEAGL